MSARKKYQTTFGFEVTVDKTEAADLRAQGLLVEDETPAPKSEEPAKAPEDSNAPASAEGAAKDAIPGKPGNVPAPPKGA